MLRRFLLSCLLTTSLAASAGLAAEVSLTLRPERPLNKIDEKVYGHFLEHIYHSCNGGLWGDLIWDRSFEGGGANIAWTMQDGCLAQEGMATDVRLTLRRSAVDRLRIHRRGPQDRRRRRVPDSRARVE